MANSLSPVRRLATYWKIEAGNAVLIPAIAVYFVLRSGSTITLALVLSGLACSFLLVIGTVVLRMMLRKARDEPDATKDRIALLAWMRWPAIGLCVAAAVALGAQCIADGVQLDARFVAPAILLLLAVLEYINYYHFQLQHFDHAPDWQRLVSGPRFPPIASRAGNRSLEARATRSLVLRLREPRRLLAFGVVEDDRWIVVLVDLQEQPLAPL